MYGHFEAVEADFAREYPGVCNGDLREALWGPNAIGVRRLAALITNLPPRSALVREMHTNGREWGSTEEMLATMCELTDMTNRLLVTFNTKKRNPWAPLSVPRPGAVLRKKRKQATGAELARFVNKESASGKVRFTNET